MIRLLFHRSTGLGDLVAEPGEIHPVDPSKAREFIAGGRAVLAPSEPELEPAPAAITTQAFVEPPPKKGRKP